jgi:hypothetical protein
MGSMTRPGTSVVLAATLAAATPAAADPPDLVLKTRVFLPGKDVVEPYGENYIYTPTAPQNGRVIVLFPGSSMGSYKSFMTAAAAHGYHVLGLDSPMTAAKGDAENAITHRLVAILQYLKAEKQGSGQFLLCRDAEPCQPDWPKITVAGQGNGAAVASSLVELHQGSGMKMLDSADCPDLEDDDEGGCWDRLLADPRP